MGHKALRNLNQLTMFVALTFCLAGSLALAATPQVHVGRIDKMADVPQPLNVIDFHALALNFDKKAYDFSQKGDHWPLVWWDRSGHNVNQPVVAMYTTIGDSRQGPSTNGGEYHEAVTSMGAVLGASLVGVDKSGSKSRGLNYVGMLKNYFNSETGWNIMQNNTNPKSGALGGGYGRDWWYDIFPNVLFYGVYSQYPHEKDFDSMARSIADKFYEADKILKGNYNVSFFDYEKMIPMTSWICPQADAAAGHSYVLYNAFKKFGDARYLKGAQSALDALESNKINPSYEVLMPFGALMAARLNADMRTSYDVGKMLDFSLDGTAVCRAGWGAIVGKWNGVDVSGIVGSTVENGGYGFLMNTFDMAWPLLPIARYDQRYASAIAKWALNAANAARLFYPDYSSSENQTLKSISGITKGVIAYEGLSKTTAYPEYKTATTSPVAQGDGPHWIPTNTPVTQFSIYGSAHVGLFGGTIQTTNVAGILRLDLLKTDFFHDRAYPTYLYSNPFARAQSVSISLPGSRAVDLYDTVSGAFIARGLRRHATLDLPAHISAVLVLVPAHARLTHENGRLLANNVVIDFHTK